MSLASFLSKEGIVRWKRDDSIIPFSLRSEPNEFGSISEGLIATAVNENKEIFRRSF